MALLKIFRGDDTGGTFGHVLQFTLTVAPGTPTEGCRAEFEFDGIVKVFAAPIVSGETREIVYTHDETASMALGTRTATFRLIDAQGRIRTLDNTVYVCVTDIVSEVYPGSSSATVVIGTGITWEQISGKPLLVKTINGVPPDANGNAVVEAGGTVKSATVNGGARIDPDEAGNLALTVPDPTFDDTVTQQSAHGVKSSGIWSWVKGLLPSWLTSGFGQPYTKTEADTLLEGKVATDDPRLTDARTPTAHASSHAVGGSDSFSKWVSRPLYGGQPEMVSIGPAAYWTWHIVDGPRVADYTSDVVGEWAESALFTNNDNPRDTFSATRDRIAMKSDIKTPVEPSTSALDAGKPADAKSTGDALAGKATTADITSAIGTHNAANDAHNDIRTAVNAKVGSFSAVGGVTPTVSGGVADVSPLFTSANTSLTGQINYTIGASGNPADHTVRTLGTLSAATTLTIAAPRVAGALRDFAITFTEPATAVGVTFSTTDAAGSSLTFYGEFLTPADGKTYIYYLTEIAVNTFLVKGEEIATVTPPTL